VAVSAQEIYQRLAVWAAIDAMVWHDVADWSDDRTRALDGGVTMVQNGVAMTDSPEPAGTRITLRLPDDLAALVRERAAAEHRSLNKEIVFLLEQAMYTAVDADAYRDSRHQLASMPRYALPRPFNRRPRRGGGGGES
jgi:hypothetical protein